MNRWRYVAFWAIIGMFAYTFMMGCGAELAATTPFPENTTTIQQAVLYHRGDFKEHRLNQPKTYRYF